MRVTTSVLIATLCAAWLASSLGGHTVAWAEAAAPKESVQDGSKKEVVEFDRRSRGAVQTVLGPVEYEASAAVLALRDETGKPTAGIFHVSYFGQPSSSPKKSTSTAEPQQKFLKEGPGEETFFQKVSSPALPASGRPVIFAFNGGPGAASAWLHLGALGPRIAALGPDGRPRATPVGLADNPLTWLAFADVVCVDPVGTGFSRAAGPAGKEKEFFTLERDVASVGEFIGRWLSRHGRWGSPKYLIGASYGTTRAAELAAWLQDRRGIELNGLILVSPVLDFDSILADGSGLAGALALPTYAAAAKRHEKIGQKYSGLDDAALEKAAEQWVVERYAPFLMSGGDQPVREALARELAELAGVTPEFALRNNLRVSPGRFRTELLRDRGMVVGRMDARITGPNLDPGAGESRFDPSLEGLTGALSAVANQFLRVELGVENDLHYELLSDEVNRGWNWAASVGAQRGGQGYVSASDALARALAVNPRLRVLLVCGRYDLATPEFAIRHTLERLGLPKEMRARIATVTFASGHMAYLEESVRKTLFEQVRSFTSGAAPR